MKKLTGIRTSLDSDFDSENGWGLLCQHASAQWWDLRGVRKINVTISRRPTDSSYECTLVGRYSDDLRIRAENTGRWHRYSLYANLATAIKNEIYNDHTFYLGVEVVN